jgi:hypothetical protein
MNNDYKIVYGVVLVGIKNKQAILQIFITGFKIAC